MNFIIALKTGRKFKRKDWASYEDLPIRRGLTRDDYLALDWEVYENALTITRFQMREAYHRLCAKKDLGSIETYDVIELLAEELGLEDIWANLE